MLWNLSEAYTEVRSVVPERTRDVPQPGYLNRPFPLAAYYKGISRCSRSIHYPMATPASKVVRPELSVTAPKRFSLRVPFEAFCRIHPAVFGQIMAMRMCREKNILTQICVNNFIMLKAAPPLVVSEAQLSEFVAAVRGVVELAHTLTSFWSEALGLARRAVNV